MLVDRAIWYIETQLSDPLTIADLARQVGISPFHLARTFKTATGLSPGTYLRLRRLSEAAKTLAFSKADILSVALDAQYNSHEAFTRAFKTHFGQLPSEVRGETFQTLTLTEPFIMDKSRIVPVAEPRIQNRDAFTVAGLSLECTFEDFGGIPQLWRTFSDQAGDFVYQAPAVYGVSFDGTETGFKYMASAGLHPGQSAPEGMESKDIPQNRYAVFTHSGHISDLPNTIYTIWNKALSDAGLNATMAPEFELYDERFDPMTGQGDVEVWIPVSAE